MEAYIWDLTKDDRAVRHGHIRGYKVSERISVRIHGAQAGVKLGRSCYNGN